MRAWSPVIAIALASAVLLAGCMGNAVTVSGQGYSTGTKSKSLDCGAVGSVAMGNQGAGKMAVTVKDGDGQVVFHSNDFGSGQAGQAQRINGQPGTWTLTVATGFGYAGQWAITLTC